MWIEDPEFRQLPFATHVEAALQLGWFT
jgi:hypothetical protein